MNKIVRTNEESDEYITFVKYDNKINDIVSENNWQYNFENVLFTEGDIISGKMNELMLLSYFKTMDNKYKYIYLVNDSINNGTIRPANLAKRMYLDE